MGSFFYVLAALSVAFWVLIGFGGYIMGGGVPWIVLPPLLGTAAGLVFVGYWFRA